MEEFNASFGAADTNQDGLLDKAEFIDYESKQHANRAARYGFEPLKGTDEQQGENYDKYWNKITPGTEGVSKQDFGVFASVWIATMAAQ